MTEITDYKSLSRKEDEQNEIIIADIETPDKKDPIKELTDLTGINLLDWS